MNTPLPITRELLMIGGGHTNALVLRLWGMDPLPGVRLTMINPEATAPYSGMLPGFVAGHYSRAELDIDLVRLVRFAGARLIRGRAVELDTEGCTATLDNGRVIPYDIAALDIGISSEMPALEGFGQFAVPAKPLGRFADEWSEFRKRCASGAKKPRAVVIGGGVAGVELAMAMAHALAENQAENPEIILLESDTILPGMARSRQEFFRKRLEDCHVWVHEGARIDAIQSGKVLLENGDEIPAGFIVGAAGAMAQGWLGGSGLDMQGGFVSVDKTLRSLNIPSVFAVGDCAHLSHAPRAKAGVFAVRQAPVLFANLRAALSGCKPRSFRPQNDYLKLISLGKKSALADKWGLMFRGPAIWQLKDRIDRRFMDQFADLRPMPQSPLPKTVADGVAELAGAGPLCGGCGAKIASPILHKTLDKISTLKRDDILSSIGDDAAVLAGPKGTFQVISTDHLRGFSNDPGVMAQIAAVHALGDIWAMGAKPQSALANVTLPSLSSKLQEGWLREIMDGANKVFVSQGAEIIGGHSSIGAELIVGFTVTGLRDSQPLGKSDAKPGDQLILTKPIGSGVVLAGEMAMKARGQCVLDAYDSMARTQGDVAEVLSDANALTDVTGFGLAGHVGDIARCSDVGFELILSAIPILAGAIELAELGVRSSLWAENHGLMEGLKTPQGPKVDLLFDPQTAGGLLAAVSAEAAPAIMGKFRDLGVDARIIGHCTDPAEGFRII